jgi:hypothetical protein
MGQAPGTVAGEKIDDGRATGGIGDHVVHGATTARAGEIALHLINARDQVGEAPDDASAEDTENAEKKEFQHRSRKEEGGDKDAGAKSQETPSLPA